jgi:hypothetical protein
MVSQNRVHHAHVGRQVHVDVLVHLLAHCLFVAKTSNFFMMVSVVSRGLRRQSPLAKQKEKEKEIEKMSSNHVSAPSGKKSRCVCARVFVCVYVCVRWA